MVCPCFCVVPVSVSLFLRTLVAKLLLMTQCRKLGGNVMKLDWNAQPVPGKSMFNLDLGIGYANVVSQFKEYEISEGVIQIDNSPPMRLDFFSDEEAIRLKKMEDENYDWQSDVALLCFEDGNLKSITTYLSEPYSYRGFICDEVRLGDELRKLGKCFTLEYDDIDETIYALNGGKLNGLALYGASCDLFIDPTQKIGAVKVFLVN